MSDEDRNHPASPQRREDALKRGQAPATPEIACALIALSVAALGRQLPQALHAAFTRLTEPLWSADTFKDLAHGTMRFSELAPPDVVPPGFGILAMVPVAIALALMIQKGFRFMPARVGPDMSRVIPHAPWGEGIDAAETCVRGATRIALGFYLGYRLFLSADSPMATGGETGLRVAAAFSATAGLWIAVAALDWLWRRHRFESSIMMTPAEVRAEARSTDGDPRVKGELKSRMEANHAAGPSRRVLLREGDTVALVTIYKDSGRTPVVQLGARGTQAAALLNGSGRLQVPIVAVSGARLLSGARPGSPIPEELFGELSSLHARLFPRPAGDAR